MPPAASAVQPLRLSARGRLDGLRDSAPVPPSRPPSSRASAPPPRPRRSRRRPRARRADERGVRTAGLHTDNPCLHLLADELRGVRRRRCRSRRASRPRRPDRAGRPRRAGRRRRAFLDGRLRRDRLELPLLEHEEVVGRNRLARDEVEAPSRGCLDVRQARCARPDQSAATSGLTSTRNACARAPCASSRRLRSISMAAVCSEITMPSPPQVGHLRVRISRGPR